MYSRLEAQAPLRRAQSSGFGATTLLLELADDRKTHPYTEEGSVKPKACFSYRRGGLIAKELVKANTNPRRALFRSARDSEDVDLPLILDSIRLFFPLFRHFERTFRSYFTIPAEELHPSFLGGFLVVVEGRIFSPSRTSGRLDDGWCRSAFARQR